MLAEKQGKFPENTCTTLMMSPTIKQKSGDNTPAVVIDNLFFRWQEGDPDVLAIERLTVGAGGRVFIEGPSGRGKTTLLNRLAAVGLAAGFIPAWRGYRYSVADGMIVQT